ncbi:MAG: bifunctional folylpolyglutamate synthase/dihydrofolate synthase [Deltaproteobacteria bacterium]|nr:bifunctional folylpolyglutamate synthase/dihydrofolate synthase [Deltaproteobacteria bacterium]
MAIDKMDQMQVDLGLERMYQIMKRLGNPHRQFRSVHIAGTNGKGSTAAFIANTLKEGGYKTGFYTSPHLERFNERVQISGDLISDDEVETISAEIKNAGKGVPGGEPTCFEFMTALAFLYFARRKVDIAVIEVGLGGRLDATNIITPLLSVITPVALDHADYLGSDLQTVAAEKGGVIKKGAPLIMGRQEREVEEVLRKIAAKNDSEAFVLHSDFDFRVSENEEFDFRGIDRNINGFQISLYGRHQVENAALALAALQLLSRYGYPSNEKTLKRGMKETFWPGRFEVLSSNPAVILDGAHNPAGAARLAEALSEKFGGDKGVLVAGFMDDKDYYGMLTELVPLAWDIILTRPDQKRSFDPEAGIDRVRGIAGISRVQVIPAMKDAINKGIMLAKDKRFIIITGSLYGVGEARGILKEAYFPV